MSLDARQLAELIEQHAGSLRHWVRTRCEAGEDVVQEAFCRLARQEPSPDNPVAWLFRVCRNLAEKQRLSDQRRRRRERLSARPEVSHAEAAEPPEVAAMLAAVDLLDFELREVLIARTWGQLSLQEIADVCRISPATAHRRYQAALAALKLKLDLTCRNTHER